MSSKEWTRDEIDEALEEHRKDPVGAFEMSYSDAERLWDDRFEVVMVSAQREKTEAKVYFLNTLELMALLRGYGEHPEYLVSVKPISAYSRRLLQPAATTLEALV